MDTALSAAASPRSAVAVLMYHAVKADGQACPGGAEANYTVTSSGFKSQLRAIAAAGRRPSSVLAYRQAARAGGPADGAAAATTPATSTTPACTAPTPLTLVTFDDGHASNAAAADWLSLQGGSADFFVNPSTVGQADFLSWPALRDMAAAGMSIQSHGYHHHYLDQMDAAQVRSELADSKKAIEDQLGLAVTLFAPPGGRQPPGLAALATAAGYDAICSSRAAYWQPAADGIEIPRLAVLAGTPAQQFERWVVLDAAELARQQRRYRTLRLAKDLLGNGTYDAVRGLLLRLAARAR